MGEKRRSPRPGGIREGGGPSLWVDREPSGSGLRQLLTSSCCVSSAVAVFVITPDCVLSLLYYVLVAFYYLIVLFQTFLLLFGESWRRLEKVREGLRRFGKGQRRSEKA